MKKVFSILLIVSLVLGTLMAQPISEQKNIPLQERLNAFDAAVAKDPQFALDIVDLQKTVLVNYQYANRKALAEVVDESVITDGLFITYKPLTDFIFKTLNENAYDLNFITENLFNFTGAIERVYFGVESTSDIPGFDKIYKLISSAQDFEHVMEDEMYKDIESLLYSPVHAQVWDVAASDFASYARARGVYFTQEEARELLIRLFTNMVSDYNQQHSFEQRAEDFFRVMNGRPDFIQDLRNFNEDFVDYLSANMGSVITNMTNAEFYNTPLLTAVDEVLLSESIDVDDEEFGAYIDALYHAFYDENFKTDLPKFDVIFEKMVNFTSEDTKEMGIKNYINYILNAPGNEENLAMFGANFAEYAATKGFIFSQEEGEMLIKEQLQYFLAN